MLRVPDVLKVAAGSRACFGHGADRKVAYAKSTKVVVYRAPYQLSAPPLPGSIPLPTRSAVRRAH